MSQPGNALPFGATDLRASETSIPSVATLRDVIARFQGARPGIAVVQILTTIVPLVALIAAMHVGLAYGWWPLLLLGLPAGALTLRTFVIQHDCGHGSFFRTRPANDRVGRLCSMFTLTPYGLWRRQHNQHHGAWNNLDKRDPSGLDLYGSCLTLAEYRAMSPLRQRLYRVVKHPAVSLLILPPLIFLFLFRTPYDTPSAWRAERRGLLLNNLALLALHGTLAATLGILPAIAVLLATIIPASIAGVWLFSLQHHFEGTHWARHTQWDPVDAALRGSSFLRLPRLLQWITGNIGFHHVHHLSPRVPNYRLAACHAAHPGFAIAAELTIADGLRASRHALWDETTNRMITFAEAA